eukprot:TRINITY_DN45384_c0_g1_i1.p1 TRINITY_DN45384_c0_g1~~TRINITY_DN45384_c0_g1_i1.p1  ORF type:complete len:351 (-),score=36.82 TRINITY_DN45384_c0_g1_i1:281-1333(-)
MRSKRRLRRSLAAPSLQRGAAVCCCAVVLAASSFISAGLLGLSKPAGFVGPPALLGTTQSGAGAATRTLAGAGLLRNAALRCSGVSDPQRFVRLHARKGGVPEHRPVALPAIFSAEDQRPVVLFDGVCNMCNWATNFILDHDRADGDRRGNFRMAALQSKVGQALLRSVGRDPDDFTSIVVVYPDKYLAKSDAVLAIARGLRWPFNWLGWLGSILPTFLRNRMYSMISGLRFKLFGKSSECRLFDDRWDERFVPESLVGQGDEASALKKEEQPSDLQVVGQTVKVTSNDIVLRHLRKFSPAGFNPVGLVGIIEKNLEDDSLTHNRPILVKFAEPRFSAHFELEELQFLPA